MSLPFTIVHDVAAETSAGTVLAVVRGAAGLSDEILQKITREMNYSETTFILSEEERDGGYDVRIFTPGGEVPFAGHPTLGTAHVIRDEILATPAERLVLNLEAGKIPVTFGDVLWMRQLPPTFGPALDPNRLARVLGLEDRDLEDRHPVREVSTGLPAIIVPVRSLEALQRCRVSWDLYRASAAAGKNLYAFCPEPHADGPGDVSARMFTDDPGIPEDPATGSAAGCLAGYLVEHRYFGTDPVDVRVEQGYEMGRPSLLYLRAEREGGTINVSVGGKVQMVARGELI
jgi:trans-2,3-dihydro-3-hydroxyanthranilate isomerase